MLRRRVLPTVAWVSLVMWSIVSSAQAQTGSSTDTTRMQGSHYHGRFIGFKPRYGQVHQPPQSQAHRALPSTASKSARTPRSRPVLARLASKPVGFRGFGTDRFSIRRIR